MTIDKEPMAQRVFDKAFTPVRTERSAAYKQGVLQCLQVRLDGAAHRECPYAIGTAEADAYFAGIDEGRALAPAGSAPFGFE